MDQKEEIKQKLDLVDIVREYIDIKAVGINFQARCPFHREKTPSFVVSPERQIFKCFGCGKGGDVFSFVMEMEGLSFGEVLRQLAPKAGVQLQYNNPREASQRNKMLDIMQLISGYYHKVLTTQPAKKSLEYLQKRGLTTETINEWQIGYSLDSWDDISKKLLAKGYDDKEIFLAGLTVKNDRGGFYDRFRKRIMFPINDYNGNPVAFSARVEPSSEEKTPQGKYINSPQTQLYDKSKILFGLDKAKQAIRESGYAIVVEGQMDVISSHQAGVKNVVASSGTALSPEQLALIKRYTSNVLFSFDADSAGQQAAERGITTALANDMNIKVIEIRDGKDPDDCIRNNVDDWKLAIAKAISIKDYYFTKEFQNYDRTDIKIKKEIAAKILSVVKQISSPIENDVWLQELASRLAVSEDVLRSVLLKTKMPAVRVATSVVEQTDNPLSPAKSYDEILAESLIALLLRFYEHFDYIISQIMPEMLNNHLLQGFYKKLVIYYNKKSNIAFNYADFRSWLHDHIEFERELVDMQGLVDTLSLMADRDFYALDSNSARQEIKKIIIHLKRIYLTRCMNELENDMSNAERTDDKKGLSRALEEFKIIADEMRALNL